MAITIRRNPDDRVLELGGGAHPMIHPRCMGGNDLNVDVRMCHNERGEQTVDFTADFDALLPIQSGEFDAVFSHFLLEHISWRNQRQLLAEMFRIVRPGGKVVAIVPNTEAQLKWIQEHQEGWDNKDLFDSASCILYGDLDYPANSHRSYFSPSIIIELFQKAGFQSILVQPYGERQTDMVVESIRPPAPPAPNGLLTPVDATIVAAAPVPAPFPETSADRAQLYDRKYFNGIGYKEFFWDYPQNWAVFQNVMLRKPESVLSLGEGRGYVVKRLQDAGVNAHGVDISKHAYLTRVCNGLEMFDLCNSPWPVQEGFTFDLIFSHCFLNHVPEQLLPIVVAEMERVGQRGLHGIVLSTSNEPYADPTRCTIRDRSWWLQRLPRGHEVLSKEEMESATIPEEIFKGDGKIKLNVGSYLTMHHHGWQNVDVFDLAQFAGAHRYNYLKCDVRQGLPHKTGEVDLMVMNHMLEHLSYEEARKFLMDCRRIIKPGGCMRIVVPDAGMIMRSYMMGDVKYLAEFDELNQQCAEAKTAAGKVWALLHEGHSQILDEETLHQLLRETHFVPQTRVFREGHAQIARECVDMCIAISLVVEAVPLVEV